jgi:hypothetical protein
MAPIATAIVLGVVWTAPTFSLPERGTTIGIVTPTVVLVNQNAHYTGVAQFTINSDSPLTIVVDILDTWTNSESQRISLPLGSTPMSGKDRLEAHSDIVDYSPSQGKQTISVQLTIPSSSVKEAPLMAGVRITVIAEADHANTENLEIVRSALVWVYAAVDEQSLSLGGYASDIRITGVGATTPAATEDSGPFPTTRFVERGPVALFISTENRGNLFAFTTSEVSVTRVTWFGSEDVEADALFQHTFREAVMLPGQQRAEIVSATSSVPASSTVFSVISEWGIYRITGSVSRYSGNPLDVISVSPTSAYFLVFPIRRALTLVALGLITILLVYQAGKHRATEGALRP